MNTVRIDLADLPEKNPVIGRRGENLCTEEIFDVSSLFNAWPNGTVTILYWRPDKKAKFLCVQTTETEVVWHPTNADLKVAGTGFVEVRMYQGEVLEKKAPIFLEIDKAPVKNSHFDDDDDEDWISEVVGAVQDMREGADETEKDVQDIKSYLESLDPHEPLSILDVVEHWNMH